MTLLSREEILRYQRQFPVITMSGQQRLKHAKILCVGAGGLGCAALQYLAAAGIGNIGIIDHDFVEISNLHRQVLYTEQDLGRHKATCAKQKILLQNSHVNINDYPYELNQENAENIISFYDLIIDASDNYKTKYLINDVCFLQKKPLIFASIFQFSGQVSIFNIDDSPCFRCIFPIPIPTEFSPNCAASGVLGILPGIIGTIQASEAIKIILSLGNSLKNRLLTIDTLSMNFKEYYLEKDLECPLCQHGQLSSSLFKQEIDKCYDALEITATQLNTWLQAMPNLTLLDVRESYEQSICSIGGIQLPTSQFDISKLNLNYKLPIVVYCKAGIRSYMIAQLLKNSGYELVYSLKGGISAWIDEINLRSQNPP